MEERSSRVYFWLCSRIVGAARFLGSVLYFLLHGGGAERYAAINAGAENRVRYARRPIFFMLLNTLSCFNL